MSKKAKTVEQTYQKKTQLEHILLRPDTYIGSTERQTQPMWVWDSTLKKIVNRPITFVPGLFKIFDEIVVNAADNKQRDPSMSKLEVTINAEENSIRVWNNGRGIPVVVHGEHGIYVPELIFGHLLTGSNFDDAEQKTTGGRNGYGAKLTNIFSSRFIVETADSTQGLKYKQEFSQNMSKSGTPKVTTHKGTDFTCISFYPDLKRFKMDRLDEDIVSLLMKRVYDIAGTSCSSAGARLQVVLDNERISFKKFSEYLALYEGIEPPIAFERVNDRWEVGVGVSDGSFQQVSFVNSICTSKGGAHVNYIADQVTARLAGVIKKKNKGTEVKANQIKNHVAVFVNALVVNPAFDSQTKETLTTKPAAFGSTCVLSEKMLKAIEKSSVVENVLNWSRFKQSAQLKKKSGSKRSKLVGITKLDDANFAGTAKSQQCTLILTEGDSAKALAVSGLGVVGRDYYGVFPLRGKLLNVREASHAQIMKNEEIQNVTKILGLSFGKTYEDTSSLRYGHVMIMTDQDHDGSHIKGLLINFFHYFWPSLLQIDGFLQQFITPIVKCTRNREELSFFTIPQYQQWKSAHEDGRGWKIKYYKGLGTSTAAEAKQYFSNLDTHEIDFQWDTQATDAIDMAFAKKRVEDRKFWLGKLEPGVHIDYDVDRISYDTFVNRELILFSHADNERSIAHFMDGFKPSQRKVLFGCFKRNLRQEIKVAQLAGYVSEHAVYHHGEQSLTQTIIGMAQNFVGSNNVNLLSPCGQFGTRLMGGKDAASPRYVFTKLENIARCIFHPDDDALLEYLDDDGQSIEPEFYVPVIPMVLVNGCEGIGTGWSSSIPTYNPREIIANLRKLIEGEEPTDLVPWFRGFRGTVQGKAGTANFLVTGTIEQTDEQTVVISELPVGKWTTDYKQFLESVLIGNSAGTGEDAAAATQSAFVKDFKENHTDTTVLFTVTMPPEKLAEFENDRAALIKKFKLETSVSTTNMHLFDLSSRIRKFDGPLHILREFFQVRMPYYYRRKDLLIKKLTEEWERLDNKARFVQSVIEGKLSLSNRKRSELLQEMKNMGFRCFDAEKRGDDPEEEASDLSGLERGFDYLLAMKLWSLTAEKVRELAEKRNAKREELEAMRSKTAEELWLDDLLRLETALDEFDAALDEEARAELEAKKKSKPRAQTRNKKATTSKALVRKTSKSSNASTAKKKSAKDNDEDSPDSDSDSDVLCISDDDEAESNDEDSDFESARSRARPAVKASTPVRRTVTLPSSSATSTATTCVATDKTAPPTIPLTATVSLPAAPTTISASAAPQKSILSFFGHSSSSSSSSSKAASEKKETDPVSSSSTTADVLSENAPAALIDLVDTPKKRSSRSSSSNSKAADKTSTPSAPPHSAQKRARSSAKSRAIDEEEESEEGKDNESDWLEDSDDQVAKRSRRGRPPSAASSRKPPTVPRSSRKQQAVSSQKETEIVDLAISSSDSNDEKSDSDYEEQPKARRRSSISAPAKKAVALDHESFSIVSSQESVLALPAPSSAFKTPRSRRKSTALESDEETPSLYDRLMARRLSSTPLAQPPSQ